MFSQQLAPIFHQTADILHEEHANVKLGRVDCEVGQLPSMSSLPYCSKIVRPYFCSLKFI